MRIACVKSDVYQDLWVCDISNNQLEIFKTSMMRCPPIGLLELCPETDFIILKESHEPPCQFNQNCLPKENKVDLKFSKTRKNPTLPFLDETHHNDRTIDSCSHDVDSIDWSKYDIVITVNTCVPFRIIDTFPNVLWCYYVGENNDHLMYNKIGTYDIILNQDVTKQVPDFSVGFPYSFIGPTTFERLLGLSDEPKHGVFMEINNTQERPVVTIPKPFIDISHVAPIIIHSQDILVNLKNLCRSKYFVKLLGRHIRGNSVLEAVSAGSLVMMDKRHVTFHELVGHHVECADDVIKAIVYYDANPDAYTTVIQKQRDTLQKLYFEEPMRKLVLKLKTVHE